MTKTKIFFISGSAITVVLLTTLGYMIHGLHVEKPEVTTFKLVGLALPRMFFGISLMIAIASGQAYFDERSIPEIAPPEHLKWLAYPDDEWIR